MLKYNLFNDFVELCLYKNKLNDISVSLIQIQYELELYKQNAKLAKNKGKNLFARIISYFKGVK